MVFGTGQEDAVTGAGITAHNSFIYTHMAYGGLAGWLYVLWMLWMARGIARMFRAQNLPVDVKLMIAALFGMAIVGHMFSNMGYIFYSSVYATAMAEKHMHRWVLPVSQPGPHAP
jgi:hypothetical protein